MSPSKTMLDQNRFYVLMSGAVTLIVSLLSGWMLLFHDEPVDPAWEKVQREEQLVVAIDPSYPPFAVYGDPVPTGIDADLAQALADELGVNVHFSWQGFDGLYDALALRHVDIIISALHPDPLRTEDVYYTAPYLDAGQVFVGVGDVPESFDDLAGKTLAVEFASDGDIAARQYEGFTLLQVDTAQAAIEAVLDGTADYALVDRISAGAFYDRVVISAPVIADPYVIAIRRENWRLAREIEQALATLRENGTISQIAERWINVVPEP